MITIEFTKAIRKTLVLGGGSVELRDGYNAQASEDKIYINIGDDQYIVRIEEIGDAVVDYIKGKTK
jgi:hypothetical protein